MRPLAPGAANRARPRPTDRFAFFVLLGAVLQAATQNS